MEYKIIRAILDDLPEMDIKGKLFKPVFSYGTQADLLKFLRLNNKGKTKNVYPLVWLETPITFSHRPPFENGRINLILATISNANLSNRERTNITFDNTLNPLLVNVIDALNTEGTRIDYLTYTTRKFFNYDSDEESGATDIWDAIQFESDLQINLNCINDLNL